MNERGIDIDENTKGDFQLTTPLDDELPKSPIEYFDQQLTKMQQQIDELKLIVFAIHNAGK